MDPPETATPGEAQKLRGLVADRKGARIAVGASFKGLGQRFLDRTRVHDAPMVGHIQMEPDTFVVIHHDSDATLRFQHTMKLAQHPLNIGNMMQDSRGMDEIHRAVFQREADRFLLNLYQLCRPVSMECKALL